MFKKIEIVEKKVSIHDEGEFGLIFWGLATFKSEMVYDGGDIVEDPTDSLVEVSRFDEGISVEDAKKII